MTAVDIPPKSNPAGRLWHLVTEGRSVVNDATTTALAKLFGCSTDQHALLLRGFLNYVELTDEVERLMKSVPGINAAKHLTWTPKVRTAYANVGLGGTAFNSVLQAFDDPALSLISICSDHLETVLREPVADEVGVRKLLAEAINLHREIAVSQIELAMREYLLKHMRIVIDALFDYRTKGFEALWDGLAAVKGHNDLAGVRIGLDPVAVRETPLWVKVGVAVTALCELVDNAQRVEYVISKGQQARQVLALPAPVAPQDRLTAEPR
jgi:hypothetical protein